MDFNFPVFAFVFFIGGLVCFCLAMAVLVAAAGAGSYPINHAAAGGCGMEYTGFF